MANINYKNIAERMIMEEMVAVVRKERPGLNIGYKGIHEDEDGRNRGQLVGIVEYGNEQNDAIFVKAFDIIVTEHGRIKINEYKESSPSDHGRCGNYQLWYEVDTEEVINKSDLRRRFSQMIFDDTDGKYDNTSLDEWINDMEEIDMIRRVW